MKTIYLKDHINTVREECLKRNEFWHHYSIGLIDQAIDEQVKNELRYRNGKTFDNYFGLASEYCNKSDVPKYENSDEAAKWEFTGFIRNSASRISRGLAAI